MGAGFVGLGYSQVNVIYQITLFYSWYMVCKFYTHFIKNKLIYFTFTTFFRVKNCKIYIKLKFYRMVLSLLFHATF